MCVVTAPFFLAELLGVDTLLVDITSGGKGAFASAGDYNTAYLVIGIGLDYSVVEFAGQLTVHGVQHFRPVHHDDRHSLLFFYQDELRSSLGPPEIARWYRPTGRGTPSFLHCMKWGLGSQFAPILSTWTL